MFPIDLPQRGLSRLGAAGVISTYRRNRTDIDERGNGRDMMHDLNYDLKNLCKRNRDGSRSTQANRHKRLQQMADDLHRMGYRHMRARSLKPKHVGALVSLWKVRDLSVGTMKNRMTDLRWWAEKVDKKGVIRPRNADYGIGERTFVAQASKAISLTEEILRKIRDVYVRMSVRLQSAFGLRREEAIKFSPRYADRGNRVVLKASWCKGGREREVPILKDEQRELLDEAHILANNGSLIPDELRYVDQLRIFERETSDAGIGNTHGLRHAYAQDRYLELTGWECPVTGGPSTKELSASERIIDLEARQIVSRELGHERVHIVTTYLGK